VKPPGRPKRGIQTKDCRKKTIEEEGGKKKKERKQRNITALAGKRFQTSALS